MPIFSVSVKDINMFDCFHVYLLNLYYRTAGVYRISRYLIQRHAPPEWHVKYKP